MGDDSFPEFVGLNTIHPGIAPEFVRLLGATCIARGAVVTRVAELAAEVSRRPLDEAAARSVAVNVQTVRDALKHARWIAPVRESVQQFDRAIRAVVQAEALLDTAWVKPVGARPAGRRAGTSHLVTTTPEVIAAQLDDLLRCAEAARVLREAVLAKRAADERERRLLAAARHQAARPGVASIAASSSRGGSRAGEPRRSGGWYAVAEGVRVLARGKRTQGVAEVTVAELLPRTTADKRGFRGDDGVEYREYYWDVRVLD